MNTKLHPGLIQKLWRNLFRNVDELQTKVAMKYKFARQTDGQTGDRGFFNDVNYTDIAFLM